MRCKSVAHRTTEAEAFFPDWFVWVFAATKRGDGETSGCEHSEPVSGSSGGSHPGAVPERVTLSVPEGPWSWPSKWPLEPQTPHLRVETPSQSTESKDSRSYLEPKKVRESRTFPSFSLREAYLTCLSSHWPQGYKADEDAKAQGGTSITPGSQSRLGLSQEELPRLLTHFTQ